MLNETRNVLDWLLRGDPSIRWQVKKDLLRHHEEQWQQDRYRIASEGWGKGLLQKRAEDGRWGGGLYTPKWISTHYSLMLLKRLGLPQDNHLACESTRLILSKGLFRDGGINLFASLNHSETCVTGMVLSLCSYFDIRENEFESLVDFLLDQQMEDGGWNCRSFLGDRHSSVHTTISVLEGLWEYEKKFSARKKYVNVARLKAHEFLLVHHLYKSDKTGRIIDPKWTRLSFPPRWRYDILRALDYFRECNAEKDSRMLDSIGILHSKEKNGQWPLQSKHAGRVFFDMERTGQASRWNTLRASRVLKWFNNLPVI
jgi:hypothetical protein